MAISEPPVVAVGSPVDWEEAILQRSVVLEEIDADVFCARKEDLWQPLGARGVFGGQTICQTLRAAIKSAPLEMQVHSLHGYFLLAGKTDRNIIFHVKRIRDGSSFATRSVEARQRGEAIFAATVQFHRVEPAHGLEYWDPMPEVPAPDSLRSDREMMEEMVRSDKFPERLRQAYKERLAQPVRMRRAVVPTKDPTQPVERYWSRVEGRLGDEHQVHLTCLAYMSDNGLAPCAYVPFGGMFRSPPVMMASLDHTMWFHSQDFRADEWMLFETRCTRAGGARILISCKVWSPRGKLILSVSQELLARHAADIQPLALEEPPRAKL